MKSAPRTRYPAKKGKVDTGPTAAQLAATAELNEWRQNIQQQQQERKQNTIQQHNNDILQPTLILNDIRSSVLSNLYPQLYIATPVSDKQLIVEECKESTPALKPSSAHNKRPTKQKGTHAVDTVVLPAIVPVSANSTTEPVIKSIPATTVNTIEHIQLPSILHHTHSKLSEYSQSIDYERLAKQQQHTMYPTFTQSKRINKRVPSIEQPALRFIDEKNYRARLSTKQPIVCDTDTVWFTNIAWNNNDVYTQRVTVTNNSTHSVKFHCQLQQPTATVSCQQVDNSNGTIASGMNCCFDVIFRPGSLVDIENAVIFTASNNNNGHSTRHNITIPIHCIRSKAVLQFDQCNNDIITLGCVLHQQADNIVSIDLHNYSDVPTIGTFIMLNDTTECTSPIQLISPPTVDIAAQSCTTVHFNIDTSNIHLQADNPTTMLTSQLQITLDNQQVILYTVSIQVTCHSLTVTAIDSVPAAQYNNIIECNEICIYDRKHHVITLCNHSALPCTYTATMTNNDTYVVSPCNGTVPPHSTTDITVSCHSTTVQTVYSILQLMYSDTQQLVAEWQFCAEYVTPTLTVAPQYIVCESLQPYAKQQYTITIYNNNNIDCQYQVQYTSADLPSNLSIDIPTEQLYLNAHTSKQVDIELSATGVAAIQSCQVDIQCTISAAHNSSNHSSTTIPLLVSPSDRLHQLYTDIGMIEFGEVALNSRQSTQFQLYNPFETAVEYTLSCDHTSIILPSVVGRIEPHMNVDVAVQLNTQLSQYIDTDIFINSPQLQPTALQISADIRAVELIVVCNAASDLVLYQSVPSDEYVLTITNNSHIDTEIKIADIVSRDSLSGPVAIDCFQVLAATVQIYLEPFARHQITFRLVSSICGKHDVCIKLAATGTNQQYSVHLPRITVAKIQLQTSEQSLYIEATQHNTYKRSIQISNPTTTQVMYNATLVNVSDHCCIRIENQLQTLVAAGSNASIDIIGSAKCPGVYDTLVQIQHGLNNATAPANVIYLPIRVRCTGDLISLQTSATLGLVGNKLQLTQRPSLQRLHLVNNSSSTVSYRPYVYDKNNVATHFVVNLVCTFDSDQNVVVVFRLHDKQPVDKDYPIQIDSNHLIIPPHCTEALTIIRAPQLVRGTSAIISGFLYVESERGWQLIDKGACQQYFDIAVIV